MGTGKQDIDAWWEGTLAWAEWYALEYVVDRGSLSGRSEYRRIGARDVYDLPKRAQGALRVLIRIHCSAQRQSVIKALRTNYPKQTGVENIVDLFEAASASIEGFNQVAISLAERKRKARIIAEAARVIAAELGHPATPSDLSRGLSLARLKGIGCSRILVKAENYESLAIAAEQSVNLPKKVGQPKSPTARRLYFLREMTDYCMAAHRRPMRSLVLALASLYFDTSDLTTNDLAKLAGVNKARL